MWAMPVIAALFGLAIYQYGYLEIQDRLASIKTEEKERGRVLEKTIAVVAEKPLLEGRLAALKEQRKGLDSKIIAGQTQALSASSLEETVKGIITGRGGSIASERVEKPENLGKFKAVIVTFDLTLPDTKALSDVLYGIETRTPYIVLKELDVRAKDFREPRELVVRLKAAALTGGKQNEIPALPKP